MSTPPPRSPGMDGSAVPMQLDEPSPTGISTTNGLLGMSDSVVIGNQSVESGSTPAGLDHRLGETSPSGSPHPAAARPVDPPVIRPGPPPGSTEPMTSASIVATAAAAVAAAAGTPHPDSVPDHHPALGQAELSSQAGIGIATGVAPMSAIGIGSHSPAMIPVSVMSRVSPPTVPMKLQRIQRDFSSSVRKRLSSSSRTGQACDRCKVRKIRCDATPGGCTQCRQNSTTCQTTDRITGRATARGYSDRLERENQALRSRLVEREQQLRDLGHECHSSDLLVPLLSMPLSVGIEQGPVTPSPQTGTPPDLHPSSPFQHTLFPSGDMWAPSPSSALMSVSAYNNALDQSAEDKRAAAAVSSSYDITSSHPDHSPDRTNSHSHETGSTADHPSPNPLSQSQPTHHHQQQQPQAAPQPQQHQQHQPAQSQPEGHPDAIDSPDSNKLKGLAFFVQSFDDGGMDIVAEAGNENHAPAELVMDGKID